MSITILKPGLQTTIQDIGRLALEVPKNIGKSPTGRRIGVLDMARRERAKQVIFIFFR